MAGEWGDVARILVFWMGAIAIGWTGYFSPKSLNGPARLGVGLASGPLLLVAVFLMEDERKVAAVGSFWLVVGIIGLVAARRMDGITRDAGRAWFWRASSLLLFGGVLTVGLGLAALAKALLLIGGRT